LRALLGGVRTIVSHILFEGAEPRCTRELDTVLPRQPLLARVVHLRQTHNRHMRTLGRHRLRRLFRPARHRRRIRRRISLFAHQARRAESDPDPGRNHQQLARLEHRSQCLNRLDLVLCVLRKLQQVVVVER
jgi:hypothetical protein